MVVRDLKKEKIFKKKLDIYLNTLCLFRILNNVILKNVQEES